MKSKDFISEQEKNLTINVPITITIPASGNSSDCTVAAPKGDELPDQAVWVAPLQQQIELMKQQGGKESKVINQLLSDNGAASEEPSDNDSGARDMEELKNRLKSLLDKLNTRY